MTVRSQMPALHLSLNMKFITFNEIALMCFSTDRNAYSRRKRVQSKKAIRQIRQQLPAFKDYYLNDCAVSVVYQWHTTGSIDTGNLMAGEKVIDDALTKCNVWYDDSQITKITHERVADTSDYVEVMIYLSDDLNNVSEHHRSYHKHSDYYEVRQGGHHVINFDSLDEVCDYINAEKKAVMDVLDKKHKTANTYEVIKH